MKLGVGRPPHRALQQEYLLSYESRWLRAHCLVASIANQEACSTVSSMCCVRPAHALSQASERALLSLCGSPCPPTTANLQVRSPEARLLHPGNDLAAGQGVAPGGGEVGAVPPGEEKGQSRDLLAGQGRSTHHQQRRPRCCF